MRPPPPGRPRGGRSEGKRAARSRRAAAGPEGGPRGGAGAQAGRAQRRKGEPDRGAARAERKRGERRSQREGEPQRRADPAHGPTRQNPNFVELAWRGLCAKQLNKMERRFCLVGCPEWAGVLTSRVRSGGLLRVENRAGSGGFPISLDTE